MIHTCGRSHLQLQLNSGGFALEPDNVENYQPITISTTPIKLYTAYLGQVTVEANVTDSNGIISLEKIHKVNNTPILVKVIDAQEHNINANTQYSLRKLKLHSATKIDPKLNTYYYVLTLLCMKKIAQLNNPSQVDKLDKLIQPFLSDTELVSKGTSEYPDLFSTSLTKSLKEYMKIKQSVISYNSSVDIFFNTCNYLDFIFETSGMVSVNGLDTLVSVNRIPKLDNAFFTGQYMMYGSGDRMFLPLTSIDVIGHELSHGLVSGTANLEYEKHSGATNEGYADILGTMFEYFMYDKYPTLLGEKDWFIGEDLGMNTPFLRNMKNPNEGNQPNKYKGKFYLDPNSQTDYGGVHINSGIINHCFYLASQQQDKNKVLSTFIKCLRTLTKTSNFMDFRDKLKLASNNDPIIIEALNKVGLNDFAVVDYGTPKPQYQHRPQPPCKHCPHHCPPTQQHRQPQPRRNPRWPPYPRRRLTPVPYEYYYDYNYNYDYVDPYEESISEYGYY